MLADLVLPVPLAARVDGVVLRRATTADLAPLMALLADDPVSASRGDRADPSDADLYRGALARILADPANDLLVATDAGGAVVGTLQLTVIPGMARRGASRLQVEAVRVRSDLRSSGIGGAMMRWVAEDAAPALGAALVQLTSDAARVDAHRFYERLGYAPSHVGFKLRIPRDA
ncbi:GNAT family N-acetyltransferase [Clavibacter phaseoli]|uniref:GNAT family N-acetyltransferase n=1 Tax=Clavibacter phaseoli TaxID=1734031 RepID=UPI000E65F19A|nr:GNAT family N-acetyltransferase [Clavibacter phaseoli]RIJ54234.1 GNAT family N-acetyltransferase [Clavibacter phaseoli]UKF31691.1 GNAT family N-acetyltransferase [Clavibacter phaseoli]UKF37611.1 GNAT family N-acetyltransferase [Clavibacter phaseoli]